MVVVVEVRWDEFLGITASNKPVVSVLSNEDDEKFIWNINGIMVDRGKLKYIERNLGHCYFVHQKSFMDCPGIEFQPPQ